MTDDCIFCRMAQGQVPCHEVFRDDQVFAFMDRGPIRPGHVQLLPLAHFPYFDDIPEPVAMHLMSVGQRIARVQKQIYGVDRIAFLFTGGDIAHAHAHLVPMHAKTDVTSRAYIAETHLTFRAAPRAAKDDLATNAALISDALRAFG